MHWAFPGFTVREVPTGLEIESVQPGTFGARVGLEPGDLLLTLAGAPVFTQRCVQALLRIDQGDAEVAVTWVHDRELREGAERF